MNQHKDQGPVRIQYACLGAIFGAVILSLPGTFVLAQVEAEQQLRDPDSKVRERAAREMGENGNPAYVPVLAAAVQDGDEKVRTAVLRALIRLGTEDSLEPLCLAVRDGIPEIRYLALDGIVNHYLPGFVDIGFGGFFRSVARRVEGMFSDVDTAVVDADTVLAPVVVETLGNSIRGAPDIRTRIRAARVAGILLAEELIPVMLEAIFGNNVDLTYEILRSFQKLKDPSVGPRISFLLNYPQKEIQERTTITLGLLQTKEAIPELKTLLQGSRERDVRRAAMESLSLMAVPDTEQLFLTYLNGRDDHMRASSALGLGRLRNPNNLPLLEKARNSEGNGGVRLALSFAMVSYGRMEYLDELVEALNSRTRRGEAEPYLVELARDPAIRELLYPKLYSTDSEVRGGLCRVLGASGDSTAVSYLEVLLKDSDSGVIVEANRAIRILRSRGM